MVILNSIILYSVVLATLASSPSLSEKVVDRYYSGKALESKSPTSIVLQGKLLHVAKFKYWLNEISKVPAGKSTIEEIINSGHVLTIAHAKFARISAGRTRAPMTENLINGKGESVEIVFDATITDTGSHFVYNPDKKLIEYTAIQNLFHELVHAKHKMNGTWRYFDSEGQAIEEENIFRKQLSYRRGTLPTERYRVNGVPVETITGFIRPPEEHNYKVRASSSYYISQTSM